MCFSLILSALVPVILRNSVNPDTIFANNEMSLQDIEIYGFDYDYTLAFYSSHLHTLIFNIARDILIEEHRVSMLILYVYMITQSLWCYIFLTESGHGKKAKQVRIPC